MSRTARGIALRREHSPSGRRHPPSRRQTARLAAGLGLLSTGASGLGCGGGATVDAVDLRFEPPTIAVERGEKVTWVNAGRTTHNMRGPGFFSKAMEPGSRYELRFEKAGTFRYVCTFHPDTMRGRVIVAD